jgi:hypothetical protein
VGASPVVDVPPFGAVELSDEPALTVVGLGIVSDSTRFVGSWAVVVSVELVAAGWGAGGMARFAPELHAASRPRAKTAAARPT